MYVKLSVSKPGLNKGVGGNKKDKIILFDFDDVLTWPAPDSKGVVITDNIVFKDGAYAIEVYGTSNTIALNNATEGEMDAVGFKPTLEFSHPGSSIEIREFVANWLSRNIGAIVVKCSSGEKDLIGTPCAALRMMPAFVDDKDQNKTTLKFETQQVTQFCIAAYQGTVTFDTVTGTIAADAASIDAANGEGRYQLSDGSVSAVEITTATNVTDGMVFTLIGSGGTNPSTIPSGNDFQLASGTTWTALAGSEITFKAFKNGASSFVFVEQSRM